MTPGMGDDKMAISTNIFSRCNPAIGSNINECGAVTLCNVVTAHTDELTSIFTDGSGNFRDLHALLATQFEIKACGARTNGLYDFLMANKRMVGNKVIKTPLGPGNSEISPFIMASQQSVINSDTGRSRISSSPVPPTPSTSTAGRTFRWMNDGSCRARPSTSTRALPVALRCAVPSSWSARRLRPSVATPPSSSRPRRRTRRWAGCRKPTSPGSPAARPDCGRRHPRLGQRAGCRTLVLQPACVESPQTCPLLVRDGQIHDVHGRPLRGVVQPAARRERILQTVRRRR